MKKRILISIVFVAASFFASTYATIFQKNTELAQAAEQQVKGWLWSDTIGWVSLNCLNTASCGTAQYGVVQNTDGTWSGYGWSDNVGWLSFSAGCPSGNAGVCGAKMEGNALKGWAKFLSAGQGWDGWVSFSSTNDHDFGTSGVQTASNTYGGSLSGINVSGYAWGSDVVGWLSFQSVTVDPIIPTVNLYLKPALLGTPVNSSNIESLPNTISMNSSGNFNLYWYGVSPYVTYTSCTTNSNSASTWLTATSTPVQVLGNFNSGSFSYSSYPGTQTYSITCTRDVASGGTQDVATATVSGVSNTISVTLQGGGAYCPVKTAGYVLPTLYWTSTNATSCYADWLTGSNETNRPTTGTQTVTKDGDYTIECTDGQNTEFSNTEKITFLDGSDLSCETKEICDNNVDDNKNGMIDEGCKKRFKFKEE